MKSRTFGILLALLACLPILILHAQNPLLLQDTDTSVLIAKLNTTNNPWHWFTHDWPLENHFYRPISTLFFEFDNRVHPGSGGGFGLTNALICSFATLALYWFLIEVKRSVPIAVAGSWLFVCWTLGNWFFGTWWTYVVASIPWIVLVLIIGRMISERKFRWSSVIVAISGFYVWGRLYDVQPKMSTDTMFWLPGRTATSMTIFALIALASYVRFERLGAPSLPQNEPGPMDPPATRSSNQRGEPTNQWGWFALSSIATVLALGSYEQAVMIPALIFILGVWLRASGYQTRFGLQIFFWAILVGYVVYRVQIIPVAPSGYQKQQFRHGSGLWIDIFSYILPGIFGLTSSVLSLSTGIYILMTEAFWASITSFLSNVSTWISIRKSLLKPLIALSLAVFAYLPMAFLKQFGHYHYFPAAMLTLFVISLFESYWPRLISSVSPQAIQAPKRLDRAPGSLPKI